MPVTKNCRRRLKKATVGYRHDKYGIFQDTMASVVAMRSDSKELKKFLECASIEGKKVNGAKKTWITEAAFSFVCRNEKQGWKAARVMEFLHDVKKVPIDELADQMKKLGGIERIVRMAAKEDPRKPSGEEDDNTSSNEDHETSSNEDYDDAWDEPTDGESEEGKNYSQVVIRMNSTSLAKLRSTKADRRVKLIGVRLNVGDALLLVDAVRRMKG
jgi:hypothetical protein